MPFVSKSLKSNYFFFRNKVKISDSSGAYWSEISDVQTLTTPSEVKWHPGIFSDSATLNEEDSSLDLIRADGSVRKFYLLNKMSERDLSLLKKKHPLVAKKLLNSDSSIIGRGTFSFVSLAKDEHGEFYAMRAILSQADIQGETKRGQVLFDTKNELDLHELLKRKIGKEDILLIEDAGLVKKPDGLQIYQVLPLADLGNGKDIIMKMSYLKPYEKTILFNTAVKKLFTSIIRLHLEDTTLNDIKPENILFTSKRIISFSDFGAATYITEDTLKQASSLKDRRYLAPFSALPSTTPLLTHKCCDLWALALTVLEFWDPRMVVEFTDAIIEMPSEATPAMYQEQLETHIFSSPSFRSLDALLQQAFRKMLVVELNDHLASLNEEMLNIASTIEINPLVLNLVYEKIETLPDSAFNEEIFARIKQGIFEPSSEYPVLSSIVELIDRSHPSELNTLVPAVLEIEERLRSSSQEMSLENKKLNELLKIVTNFLNGQFTHVETLNKLNQFKASNIKSSSLNPLDVVVVAERDERPAVCPY